MASTLSVLLVASAAVYLIIGCITLSGGDWRSTSVMGAAFVFEAVPWWLRRRGRLQASALILIATVLATVTVAATLGQGIRDMGVVVYPILFIFAGLTLTRRLFALCVGLTLAAITWLALGEAYGGFVTQPFFGDPSNLIYLTGLTIVLLVGALAVHLLATNARGSLGQVRQELAERKRVEHKLRKRTKELQARYSLAEIAERDDISLDELYQELTDILPNSWQYEDIACARIRIGAAEFRTGNFAESPWRQSAPVRVTGTVIGAIDVSYLDERPKEDEGPFLKEERRLLAAR
jgi:hypothetical protein